MQPNPYQSLVSLLSNILEAYTTAFFIWDPKDRQLKLAASQTLSKHLPDRITLPMEKSGILSQVYKMGQTVHLDKVHEASSNLATTVPFYREGESHIKGLFAMPVGDGSGVLYVDTKYSWGFNDKQQKWIREIASVLGELVERQNRLGRQKTYGRILELLHSLDQATLKHGPIEEYCGEVVQQLTRFLDAEYGFLAVREPNEAHPYLFACTPNVPRNLLSQRFLTKQGLVGWVFENLKPLVIPRMNPQSPEHFLFGPSEALPHHGTFWGMPIELSLGHAVVLSFLTRTPGEWSADDQYALSHVLLFLNLFLDRFYLQDECKHLRCYDFSTGLYNAPAFESRMEALLSVSMQESSPLTFTLVQFEPWQLLWTKASPREVRRYQMELASIVCESLPSNSLVGQLAENRFGLLLPGTTLEEARNHQAHLMEFDSRGVAGRTKGIRLKPYIGMVAFPQDGTRIEELWPTAHQRLYAAFRAKTTYMG
ncbi:MAG: diguanylate cyclase [Syntrophobacteraceae bacterium]|nr:diguanylate cyclase [Syntrophobacteraceae bacterium]